MPSCDGSNCGACACNCKTRTVYVDPNEKLKARNEELEKLVEKLQKELDEKQ